MINPDTGLYTAPDIISGGLETAEIESLDNIGSSDISTIRVYSPMTASPSNFYIRISGDPPKTITVLGGYGDYSITPERGTVSSATVVHDGSFDYTPPVDVGNGYDYIEITDALNNSVSVTAVIGPAAGTILELLPSYAVLTPSGTKAFTVSGAFGIFTNFIITLEPAFGTFTDNGIDTISYTAPTGEGSTTLTVEDEAGATASSDIYIASETPEVLEINPSFVMTSPGTVLEFIASGGIPPYTFTILSGAGYLEKISPTTMKIETSSPPPLAKIRVTDAVGSTATANIDLKEK